MKTTSYTMWISAAALGAQLGFVAFAQSPTLAATPPPPQAAPASSQITPVAPESPAPPANS
ncbi:MAG: hypothetical protein WAL73_03300, partial [Terracidiphilus sp.]